MLHSFATGTDGSQPDAGLINVGGTLYGTTSDGPRRTTAPFFRLLRNVAGQQHDANVLQRSGCFWIDCLVFSISP